MKSSDKFLISLGCGLAAVSVYVFFIMKKKKVTDKTSTADLGDEPKWPLKEGDSGPWVKKLQDSLQTAFGTASIGTNGANGTWRGETSAALKRNLGISQIKSKEDYYKTIETLATF